jgi:hypothetical protein
MAEHTHFKTVDDHVSSAFILKSMMNKIKGTDGAELRGPFVYFVPKDAICGAKHHRPVPTMNLIHNPMAPGRMVGVASPLPSYLTNAEMPVESILALVSTRPSVGHFF